MSKFNNFKNLVTALIFAVIVGNVGDDLTFATSSNIKENNKISNSSNTTVTKDKSNYNYTLFIDIDDIDFEQKDVKLEDITKENIEYDLEQLKKVLDNCCIDVLLRNVDYKKKIDDIKKQPDLDAKNIVFKLKDGLFRYFNVSHTSISYWGKNYDDKHKFAYLGNLYNKNSEVKYFNIMNYNSKGGNHSHDRYISRILMNNAYESKVTTKILKKDEVAYVGITSFFDNTKENLDIIDKFCYDIKDYPYLIIDIRENTGGYQDLWVKLIEKLTNKELEDTIYVGFKRGKITDSLINDIPQIIETLTMQNSQNINYNGSTFEEIKELPNSMENIDPKVKDMNLRYFKIKNKIVPKNNVGFNGKVYIITNDNTASSSEQFMKFAKGSGFAKIIGSAGRGIGIGVGYGYYFYQLPYTGIVVEIETSIGFNEDGSINNLNGLKPDVKAFKNRELDKALELIEEDKNKKKSS